MKKTDDHELKKYWRSELEEDFTEISLTAINALDWLNSFWFLSCPWWLNDQEEFVYVFTQHGLKTKIFLIFVYSLQYIYSKI